LVAWKLFRRAYLFLGGDPDANSGLEGIIDPPLKAGQGSNHDNTGSKATPNSFEAKLREDLSSTLSTLGHLGHHGVSRVRDNGASNTSDVARSESDTQVLSLGVSLLRGGEDVLVKGLLNLLKEEELGHGVRDLTGPQGDDGLEGEARVGISSDGSQGGAKSGGESSRDGGLDLHLDHLHGAKGDISENFGRSRTSQVNESTVFVGGMLTNHGGVEVLEEFVETEFQAALSGVTDQSRQPALEQGGHTLFGGDQFNRGDKALVLGGINLHVALSNIKRSDSQVGQAATEDTANAALEVKFVGVRGIVGITSIPLGGRG